MPLINRNLFRLGQIIRTAETDHLMVEIIAICEFTKCEAKATLNAFQQLAKILAQTDDYERALRQRVFMWELKFMQFRYTELKANPEGHVIIRFFNGLVRFKSGEADAFDDLLNCIVLGREKVNYDFAW